MKLHFDPIGENNREELLALRLLPEQKGFVETVAECLEEAEEDDRWRTVGIYDGSTPVGFSMYGLFRGEGPAGRAWLDRLLIDRAFQGRGYGSAAMEALLQLVADTYHKDEVYLSVYESNTPAIGIYKRLGCRFNGELDFNGEKVMVWKKQA